MNSITPYGPHPNPSPKLGRGAQINQSDAGLTLLEILVALVIVGVLAAIAAPGLIGFLNLQRLSAARGQALQAIREAQNRASSSQENWQISFWNDSSNVAHWDVHPADECPTGGDTFNSVVQVGSPTNFNTDSGCTVDSTNPWYVEFDYHGNVTPPLGRVTLTLNSGSSAKRCVIISTLLGATRTENDGDC